MAGPLKNARHERFAQELAKGKSADEAYGLAGYQPNRGNAATLKANQNVEARVAALQGRAAAKVVITVADIAAQLDEDRAFARKHKHSAAAVSATMGKAKVLGVVVERHAGADGGPIRYSDMSEAEIDARLAKLLGADEPADATD